jgi:hypothetical protein
MRHRRRGHIEGKALAEHPVDELRDGEHVAGWRIRIRSLHEPFGLGMTTGP